MTRLPNKPGSMNANNPTPLLSRGSTAPARRRGSVIVLVVGVLAVVAISAVTYVNIVSLDRRAASAVQRRVNYQQQADAVMNHIRSLIGADLFGDKITTNATPARVGDDRVWPRMFEDGEFWDMAYTTRNTGLTPFDESNPLAELDPDDPDARVGMRHDAWLASTEPLWVNNSADTWPQITNLRTGYRYITPQNNPGGPGKWVSDDARFADLARWFEDDQNGQGNPGADLTDFSDPISGGENDFRLGLDQRIYDLQVDEIAQPFDVFDALDERAWVDTDGDLRPDARWQQLEVLGNNAGLIWVTAARIIDASALLNYNAALEFSYAIPGTLPPRASDGRTPADIDAWGLFDLADDRMQDIAGDTRVRGTGTLAGFRQHLEDSLLIPDAIAQMTTLDPTYPNVENLTTYLGVWAPDSPQTLTTDQRANYWRYVSSSPLEPAASKGASHRMQDLIDLCAFWGTNHRSIYSTIEQDIDLQFPPQANAGQNAAKGALRANEDPSFFRSLDQDSPSIEAMKADTRRLLTPYSGVGRFSPVPVINDSLAAGSNEFEALFSLIKPDANRPQVDDAATIFASFMWALAPLATDEPLMRPLTKAEVDGTDFDFDIFHYGGGTVMPVGTARWIVTEDQAREVGATYAVRTSLALTANLMDCGDTNKNPTVLRFFPRMDETERAFTDISGTPAIELSDRLPQGNIRVSALAYPTTPIVAGVETAVGTRVGAGDIPTTGNIADQMGALRKGITVVGLERQPFLREAFSAAFYSDMAEVAEEFGNQDGEISADGPEDHTGYLFAVELANPWDTEINIDGYEVVLPASPQEINAAMLDGLRFVAPDLNIPPGGVAVLIATNLEGDLRDAALDAMPESLDQVVVMEFVNVLNAPAGERIIFRQHAESGDGRLPVLLTYPIGATTAGPEFAVVDLMRPEAPGSDQDGFPRALTQDHFATQLAGSPYLFADSVITDDNDMDMRLPGRLPQHIGARMMISSSFSRPGGQPTGVSGMSGSFPAYCIELNKGDNNLMNTSPREQFENYDSNFTAQWGWLIPPIAGDTTAADVYQNATVTNAPELLAPMAWTDATAASTASGSGDGVHSDLGENDKYSDSDMTILTEIPPFQLYCRDGVDAFPTPASVAQLCTFAHFCLNHELNNLRNWTTVSEQLTLNRFYNTGTVGGVLNPYMGTLDVSRFILNDTGAMTGSVTNLPDPLAVPLATRVFDCFETLSSSSDLNQGQVNLNTAPVEVLAHLPFIWPRRQIGDGGPTPPLTQLNQFDASAISSAPRLDYLTQYRASDFTDVVSPAVGATPDTLTNILPLRVATGSAVDFRTPGFVSMGEVSILDQWTAGQPNANNGTQLFQSLGTDGLAANAHPFDITTEPTGFLPYAPAAITTNPTDDIEEKLALFRGMVNCASTRSDVFLAWFVVRGYDPDLIESIEVPGNAAEALNDERFAPTYESRWLCLFDRSNMRRPTDRPRLLMYVELPNARP